jgi:hypothetical protein
VNTKKNCHVSNNKKFRVSIRHRYNGRLLPKQICISKFGFHKRPKQSNTSYEGLKRLPQPMRSYWCCSKHKVFNGDDSALIVKGFYAPLLLQMHLYYQVFILTHVYAGSVLTVLLPVIICLSIVSKIVSQCLSKF